MLQSTLLTSVSSHLTRVIPRTLSTLSKHEFENLKIKAEGDKVVSVTLNRPKKKNALSKKMWDEIGIAFTLLNDDTDCRSIVLSGETETFCAGIDLNDFMAIGQVVMGDDDIARKAFQLKPIIEGYQKSFTDIEKCRKPVICAIHGACVGGAVDLISATDIRFCSEDAWFQVKEVDIGIAADVGTLQRLPKILGSQSLVNELCLTARKMYADEALSCGLVSRVLKDKEQLLEEALSVASSIAVKSPVAVQGTKLSLVHARDHTVQEGLDYMCLLNMTMLQSEDVRLSVMKQLTKSEEEAEFAPL